MELFRSTGGRHWSKNWYFFRWAEILRFYTEIYDLDEVKSMIPAAAKSCGVSETLMWDVVRPNYKCKYTIEESSYDREKPSSI